MSSMLFALIATSLTASADDCGSDGRYANNIRQVYPSTAIEQPTLTRGDSEWDYCLVDEYGDPDLDTCEPDEDRPGYLTKYCHCFDNGKDYTNGTVQQGHWFAAHCDLPGQNCNGLKYCFDVDDYGFAYSGLYF